MTDARTPRTLLITDHLWQAFEQMAAEMGSDRDGLVNQALFTFARRNGYLVPGAIRGAQQAQDDFPDAGPLDARAAKRPRRSSLAAVRPDHGPRGQDARGRPLSARKPADAEPDAPEASTGKTLVLLADGREIDRIVKSRFVIGRGKHCDLVVQSGKVSREHAAISREGDVWFIEDLGSSNGTWCNQRRITRRQIREGDEYFICAERLSCTFR
jgi:hypothetical protein